MAHTKQNQPTEIESVLAAAKTVGIDSLTEQGLDDLDFVELSRSQIESMLRNAYEAGRKAVTA